MKHLELHIIQSVPVACLNRDDLNSPKTAVFGGVQRARVSSQSWKRAIRDKAKEIASENSSNHFKGNRTKRFVSSMVKRLQNNHFSQPVSTYLAEQVANIVENLDTKTDSEGFKRIKTIVFFSDAEYDSIVGSITDSKDVKDNIDELEDTLSKLSKIADNKDNKDEFVKLTKKTEAIYKKMKIDKKEIIKAIKTAHLEDGADIAIFGRMVASHPDLKVEGASMFSHALSTHKVDNEIDFFSAVDDLQQKEESGAGMTGTLEFNSATYYRFAALDLDMLSNEAHLADLTLEQRQDVVKTFVEATIKAMPTARKTTMNSNTMPDFVLCIVREKGHPIQLINAFEKPVRSSDGYILKSMELLKAEHQKLSSVWGINEVWKYSIPDDGAFETFLSEVVKYVR